MALQWDESSLDLNDSDKRAVIQLQAVSRGWLTRKELQNVQCEFLAIVAEIDGDAVTVEWTQSLPPHPVVRRAAKQSRKRNREQKTEQGAVTDTPCPAGPVSEGAGDCDVHAHRPGPVMAQTDQQVQTALHTETGTVKSAGKGRGGGQQHKAEEETPNCSHAGQHPTGPQERHAIQQLCFQQSQSHIPGRIDSHGDECEGESWAFDDNRKDRAGQVGEVQNVGVTTTERDRTRSYDKLSRPSDSDFIPTTDTNTPTTSLLPASWHLTLSGETRSQVEQDLAVSGETRTHVEQGPTMSGETQTQAEQDPTLSGSDARSQVERDLTLSNSEAQIQAREGNSSRMRGLEHGDQTSVWDSSSSVMCHHDTVSKALERQQCGSGLPSAESQRGAVEGENNSVLAELTSCSTEALLQQRQNVAMELLWVQQAIISRKQYLKLKAQMEVAS